MVGQLPFLTVTYVRAWPVLSHKVFQSCLSPSEHILGVGLADGTPRMESSGIWSKTPTHKWPIAIGNTVFIDVLTLKLY